MPSALLVHGITSSGTTWWRVGADLEDLGWSVRTPTLPGHGGIRFPAGATDPLQTMADAIAGELDGRPVDLLHGHSLGALVVLTVAAQHPEVARVVVIEDPPTLNGAPMADLVGDIAGDAQIAEQDPDGVIVRTLEANPAWSLIDARESVANAVGVDVAATARLVATASWDLPALVAACPLPLFLIAATEEQSAMQDPERRAVLDAIGAARTTVLASGHSVHRDRPGLWLRAVLDAAG